MKLYSITYALVIQVNRVSVLPGRLTRTVDFPQLHGIESILEGCDLFALIIDTFTTAAFRDKHYGWKLWRKNLSSEFITICGVCKHYYWNTTGFGVDRNDKFLKPWFFLLLSESFRHRRIKGLYTYLRQQEKSKTFEIFFLIVRMAKKLNIR